MPDRLDEYRRKRDAARTPEPVPAGKPAKGRDNRFVIQQHHATSLHWDLRLERDGVLVSWAVPRGLPRDPKRNHLAVHTEDHPMEYASFEGVIPEGNYGAGKVILWDMGTYESDVETPLGAQLDRGEIKFTLHGKKLKGSFVLIHTGRRATVKSRANQWLLIKHREARVA